MYYFFDKTRLAVSTAAGFIVIVLAVASPQVLANGPYDTSDTTTRAMEQKIKDLESQLNAIRNEMGQVRSDSVVDMQQTDEIEQITTRLDNVETIQARKNHRVFFRGGWSRSNETHNAVSIESRVAPVVAQERADRDAWYIGAGFDFSLTDDVWGLMPKTEVVAELMFEYKNFKTGVPGNALANEPTPLAPVNGAANPRGVTVSQFTLTAAPKIKFMEGSKFRPWIIPAGLAIHVISPPSESITVLDPGVMFGAGAEYNLWKDLYLGVDARYHLTVGTLDGAKIDGLTAGGYLGIGF